MSLNAAAPEPDRAPAVPILEARDIGKRFGPTLALDNVRLRVMAGESHALVGRNGAGKSTLVAIRTGLLAPDRGSISFSGMPAPALSDRAGWRQRVACVYQHSTIIPDLTVAENLFINRQPRRGGFIDWRRLRTESRELLARWHVEVPDDSRAGDLSVEQRQMVEIARALSYGARLIILDEPTAQLDGAEIKRLFAHMRDLQAAGITFLFISHHLQEVYDICQEVTVLRDARHIITAPVAELPRERLIEAMTGEQGRLEIAAATTRAAADGQALLEIEQLAGPGYADVSLAVRGGEIVGLAGATSSGNAQVAEAVAGLGPVAGGRIRIGGRPLPPGDVTTALGYGVGCVPKSRHRQGLVLLQSVAENATMTVARQMGPAGFIAPAEKERRALEAIRRLDIVTQGPEQPVSGLSGGNQQKVVMGRALATDPKVLVLLDPTAGVDVRSKTSLLGAVEEVRRAGKAILMVSSELEDLRICDRVLVMRHGRVVGEFDAGWTDTALIAAIEGL